MFKDYILFEKKAIKGKKYRLDRKKDFQKFYLMIRGLRQNLLTAEKYKRHQEMA